MGDDNVIRLGKCFAPEGTKGTEPVLCGEAKCLACAHEWAATAPMPLQNFMDCPSCGCARGVMKQPVLRDGDVWQCPCGNELFRISKAGVYCPNCGDWQRFPAK